MSTSTPIMDPSQPPPMAAARQGHGGRSGHGSVGPVIGVLVMVTLLCIAAVMIGRLCSGRRITGLGQYDFESWLEAKCGPCIDGRVDPCPARRVVVVEHRVNSSSRDEERAKANCDQHGRV